MKRNGPYAHLVLVIILISSFSSINAFAAEFVFETNTIRYVINSDGLNVAFQEKGSGKDWIADSPSPFAHVTKTGKTYPVTRLTKEGECFLATFGNSGITARYKISALKSHITIELESLSGGSPDSIQLCNINSIAFSNSGRIIAAQWNDDITVCLMALSERVNSQAQGKDSVTSTVYPEFGMIGEKTALIAVPTSEFLDVVQEVEKTYHLPSPRINGKWAKQSPDVDTNYLFIDVSEKTADQVIAHARLGGFKYVLVPWSSWASSLGSYPINTKNFPNGEESLKKTIDKFHAAGLKVGMHMLTSLISKNDPLVRPIPDGRFLKDASTSLANDIDESATTINATDDLTNFLKSQHFSADISKYGIDIQIDDEIIHCVDVETMKSRSFSRCQRGRYGTEAKSHQSGVPIHRLVQRSGRYMADLRTSLKDQIAERIAEVINRCGFDMIYFDGGELDIANGPGWYWVGQQQTAIWKRLNRDVLFQGSGMSHWLWHIISRGTCDDHAAIAVKAYMDHHKINRLKNYRKNFMPAELGWCGLLDGGLDHPATTVEDMEHYGIRMIAFDVPISIQTNLKKLESNPQTGKILERLKRIDEFRRSARISASQREQLKTDNWSLFDVFGNVAIKSIKDESTQLAVEHHQTKFKTRNASKTLKVPDFPGALNGNMRLLFQGEKLLDHPASKGKAFRPGEPLCSVYLTDKVANEADCQDLTNEQSPNSNLFQDLRDHQALAVTISVKGSKRGLQPPYPVLNVQLEDNRMWYRDYYIDLDFIGEKTIIIPRTNADRLLPEFGKPEYNIKKALRYFDYGKVARMNLRWMRKQKDPGIIYTVTNITSFEQR